jgi:hypothetical protein
MFDLKLELALLTNRIKKLEAEIARLKKLNPGTTKPRKEKE